MTAQYSATKQLLPSNIMAESMTSSTTTIKNKVEDNMVFIPEEANSVLTRANAIFDKYIK